MLEINECVHGRCCGEVTCHGMASWQHPSLSPSGPRLLWRRGYQHQMPSAVVLLLCCWLDHLHAAANASVHCSAGQRCPSVAVHIGPHQTQVIPDTLLCTSKHVSRMILIYFLLINNSRFLSNLLLIIIWHKPFLPMYSDHISHDMIYFKLIVHVDLWLQKILR